MHLLFHYLIMHTLYSLAIFYKLSGIIDLVQGCIISGIICKIPFSYDPSSSQSEPKLKNRVRQEVFLFLLQQEPVCVFAFIFIYVFILDIEG